MGVDIQRHADAAMPKHFTDDLGMHALLQKQCCGCMPHVMKADAWEPRFIEQGPEAPLHEIGRFYWLPDCIRKDEVIALPLLPQAQPLCGLSGAMLTQGVHRA